jgi:polyisoprenoid-binding protein YceI
MRIVCLRLQRPAAPDAPYGESPVRTAFVALAISVMVQRVHAAEWLSGPSTGRIVVHVHKKGLFSAFAHDHHFEATEFRVTADLPAGDPGSAAVVLVVDASSLRDRQPSLSEDDRRKVEAQVAGPDVLDAQHSPRIEFRAHSLEAAPGTGAEHVRGTLHGTLTIRGRSRPIDVTVEAERNREDEWRVRGKTRLKQTAFGIEPFSGFAGTVAVKDEVDVELALILHTAG